MRYVLMIAPLVFCACSTRTITQEVVIPTKCTITPTPKPAYTGDLQKDLRNILVYDEMIQRDLEFCTNKP